MNPRCLFVNVETRFACRRFACNNSVYCKVHRDLFVSKKNWKEVSRC